MHNSSFFQKLKKFLYIFQISDYDADFFEGWVQHHPDLKWWLLKPPKGKFVWTPKAIILFIFAIIFFPLAGSYRGSRRLAISIIRASIFLQPFERFIISFIAWRAKRKLKKFSLLRVIGIAGSFGKTTTKECLAAVLSERFKLMKSPENINTFIGIAQLILRQLRPEHELLLLEMAAYRRGEIAALRALARPHIGVLTGIGQSHLQRFGSFSDVVEAKFELVRSSLGSIQAVLNADSPAIVDHYQRYVEQESLWYGVNPHVKKVFEVKFLNVVSDALEFEVWKRNSFYFRSRVNLLGRHQIQPILGAITLGDELGLGKEELERGLKRIKPLSRRLCPISALGAFTIDDTYNISLESATAALSYLQEVFPDARKIVVTAGFVEAGTEKINLNRRLGKMLGDAADLILSPTTSNIDYIIEGLSLPPEGVAHFSENSVLPQKGMIKCKDAEEIHQALYKIVKPEDVVLMFPYDLPEQYY